MVRRALELVSEVEPAASGPAALEVKYSTPAADMQLSAFNVTDVNKHSSHTYHSQRRLILIIYHDRRTDSNPLRNIV